MNFKMDLLENSYDFLYNSMDFYHIADEHGTHDPQRSDIECKKKWKMAYIFLVQSLELLIKEGLYRISPSLIFENIDSPSVEDGKTVVFSKSIHRIINFSNITILSQEEINFLNKCAKIRNEYIHYKVEISTPELKNKYCKLFELYKNLHNRILGNDLILKDKKYYSISLEIKKFSEDLTVFRGEEIDKDRLIDLKEELEKNRKHCYYKDSKGALIPRIKFGEEPKVFSKSKGKDMFLSVYTDFKYCGDCSAEQGEYHLDGCDLEVCPVCLGQKLSCDCDLHLSDEQGNIFISPYEMQ